MRYCQSARPTHWIFASSSRQYGSGTSFAASTSVCTVPGTLAGSHCAARGYAAACLSPGSRRTCQPASSVCTPGVAARPAPGRSSAKTHRATAANQAPRRPAATRVTALMPPRPGALRSSVRCPASWLVIIHPLPFPLSGGGQPCPPRAEIPHQPSGLRARPMQRPFRSIHPHANIRDASKHAALQKMLRSAGQRRPLQLQPIQSNLRHAPREPRSRLARYLDAGIPDVDFRYSNARRGGHATDPANAGNAAEAALHRPWTAAFRAGQQPWKPPDETHPDRPHGSGPDGVARCFSRWA